MLFYLLLLFTVLPLVEFSLLLWIHEQTDLITTVLIVLGTGALGAALAKQRGLATLSRIQRQLASGEAPTDALVDGAMILLAGAVLITPGVLTDAFGFALLAPPVRAVLKPLLRAWFVRRMRTGASGVKTFVWTSGGGPQAPFEPQQPGGRVVDVEVTEVRTRVTGD